MIALKSFRPANHKQVGAKIISAHDLFKIVGSLQISSKTPEPWKIVINRGSCQEAVIAEAGISRKVLIPRPRYGGCVRANSTAEAVSQVSTITGNDAVFYG